MRPFLLIIFFFLCLYAFVKVFGPLPFYLNNASANNVFTVQGTGEVDGTPQTAMVSLGVSITAATVQDAQNQVNQKANQIITDIQQLGVSEKEIKTTNYSSYPVNPPVAEPMTLQAKLMIVPSQSVGQQYTVSEDLEVTLPSVEIANKVIDTATADGATNIGGVQFKLSDDKQQELENQARTKAIADAKKKAEEIAKESGLRLGQIVNVEESGSPYPVYMMGKAESAAVPDQSTNLQPGQNKVQVTVTLSYQTY